MIFGYEILQIMVVISATVTLNMSSGTLKISRIKYRSFPKLKFNQYEKTIIFVLSFGLGPEKNIHQIQDFTECRDTKSGFHYIYYINFIFI
jgi:hypothetical protein